MKTPSFLILSAALVAAVSCTTIKPQTDISTKFKPGVPGGEVVQTSIITAAVAGIDAAKRRIALVTPDGKKFTVKAGPEVVNFDQIRIGDRLLITFTEEIVIRMAKPGEETKDGAAAVVGLAAESSKPGVMTAETVQVTATVTAIDLKKRKATLQFADGSSKKVAVRQDVDLSRLKVGEKVVIRVTGVFAILVEKP